MSLENDCAQRLKTATKTPEGLLTYILYELHLIWIHIDKIEEALKESK